VGATTIIKANKTKTIVAMSSPRFLEQRLKTVLPGWHAMDLRLMFQRYQTDGAVATAADVARLTALLGRAPRSYRDFARDATAQWARG
jgi:hypothetical protein